MHDPEFVDFYGHRMNVGHPRMVPERKEELLEALGSGKYEKGKDVLRKADRFCCLGVECNLYRIHRADAQWRKRAAGYTYDTCSFMGAGVLLPSAVAEWSGISSLAQDNLAKINDSTETFDEVIEYIETYL